jgi:type IV pilus biogenesis protein CpaD/CtpE
MKFSIIPAKYLRGAAGLAAIAGLASTAACSPQYDPFNPAYDPLVREGLFQPGHTNHQNLALQVANPGDLVRGSGATTSDGQQAAAAVQRWRDDKVKKLPAADLAQVAASSSGSNDSNGSSGGGGSGGQ